MRLRSILAGCVVLVGLALIAVWLSPLATRKRPPVITLTSIEPAGIFDDNGEMCLVTLSLKDPDFSRQPEGALCLRKSTRPIEVRVNDRWIAADARLDWHGGRQGVSECELLLPSGASACRLALEYTGAVRSFRKHPLKGPILWGAEHLPLSLRRQFSYKFWRWAGFPEYGPGLGWRSLSLDLPLASVAAAPPL